MVSQPGMLKYAYKAAQIPSSRSWGAHKPVLWSEGYLPDQSVLVVSHGALLKSLLIDYENWPISKIWADPHMDNCGHSIVEYGNGAPKVIKFADHDEW